MAKELNTDWSLKLIEMQPTWTDNDDVIRKKTEKLAEYVKTESGNTFCLDKYSGYIVQKKKLPWSRVFDVIKNAPKFGFVVPVGVPPHFKIRKPNPARGTMYAFYDAEKDAVLLRLYTGERREELAGYDGWGRESDELEVIEGLRDRNGIWLKELELKWI